MNRAQIIAALFLALVCAIIFSQSDAGTRLLSCDRAPSAGAPGPAPVPAPRPPPAPVNVSKLMGTIVFHREADRGAGDMFLPYWYYLNGRIVKRVAESGDEQRDFSVLTAAGEYKAELVTQNGNGRFPLVVTSLGSAQVVAGQSTEVLVPVVELPLSARAAAAAAVWTVEWAQSVDKRLRDDYAKYTRAPIVSALTDARAALAANPAWSATVYVRLPDGEGGARELDARQVRAIVEYLDDEWWSDYQRYLALQPADDVKPYYDAIANLVAQVRKQTAELNGVAEKLEEVERQP